MGATQTGDVAFVPKVWNDHVMAYFDRKMGLGQLALINRDLQGAPGETVNFPYWKTIGDAEKPAQDAGLTVDPLQDDSFSVTVSELAKAVGWKDKALRKSAANPQGIRNNSAQMEEARRQMAQRLAEGVDKDVMALLEVGANYTPGFIAGVAGDLGTVQTLAEGAIIGFGDKMDQVIAHVVHSFNYLSILQDAGTGFLKADATDPLYNAPGFMGRLLGSALFVLDSVPRVADVGGKKTYASYSLKANPFGIAIAEELNPEMDRDILHRETIVTSTLWYGTLGLHAKVSADDKRVVRNTFTSKFSA